MTWRGVLAAAIIALGLWESHPFQTTITIPDHIVIEHDVSGAIQLAPGTLTLSIDGIPSIPPFPTIPNSLTVHGRLEVPSSLPPVIVQITPSP